MSDDLSALLRAAALEEEAAARRETPYSAETLGRYVRDVRRRRSIDGAMLAIAGVVVIGGVLAGADRLAHAGPATPIGFPTAPSVTPMPTPEPTSTPATTPTPTSAPTALPTPSSIPAPPPTTPPPTTSAAPTHVAPAPPSVAPLPQPPGAVTGLSSVPGGGSGEVLVHWAPTARATGYRVYRSDLAAGPFALSATYDVATARTTVAFGGAYDSIQIWQAGDQTLEYVEAIRGGTGYFRVTAFNAGGEGPMSAVVCGAPVAGSSSAPC